MKIRYDEISGSAGPEISDRTERYMLGERLKNVRKNHPLIHNITNYVTVNDCANILLACGASPIMSDDEGEVEDVTSICSGLNINMGTLHQGTVPAMIKAGKRANELGHPVLLDPVGAGSSRLRTQTALRLLEEIRFSAIRGNVTEIRTLARGAGASHGVDADMVDRVTEETLDGAIRLAETFARSRGAVVAMTGVIDIVTDGSRTFCIRNGHSMMSTITGGGCQLSAMMTAYLAANPSAPLEAAAAAAAAMGLCGEKAYERMGELDGNASYRNYLIDAVFRLTPEELDAGARYELR